jgi:4-hydroxyacetophenone monooxygenase
MLDQTLSEAVDQADLRVLLMVLVHLTGDTRWLEPPYAPRRDVRLVADPEAGLPPDAAQTIRARIKELLAGDITPVVTDPGDELMLRMMRVCLGEEVDPEYVGMFREDLGFVSKDRGLPAATPDLSDPETVLIVGAGASGIALGAQLNRMGIGYRIVEKNTELGGTWWENRYPGCGVDTPNHAYSFSTGTRNRWTRYFALRDELEAYLLRSADEFDVRRHAEFQREVVSATWDDDAQRWHVEVRHTDTGETERRSARFFVSAVGVLNIPKDPDIAGLHDFSGPMFHSARWRDDVDLHGKRVAVIGTGASSMQLVPSITPIVSALTIYQRSPQWARNVEGYRDDIGSGDLELLERLPFYVEWFRFTMFWRYGDGLLRFLKKDPDWPHPERAVNRINDRHRQEMADHMARELDGRPDLLAKCMPTYPPYGKRMLIDNGWFRALREPHVELVDDAIDRLDADGVVIRDGTRRDHDVVILATGFATTVMAARMDVTGRGGRRLRDEWADDNPTAYLGITVPGFPNLFCMLGPNTGLAHGGSAIFQSECQARYITAAILEMARAGVRSIEPRPDVHEDFVHRCDAEHEQLIWTHPGMTNWYRNPGGRIVALIPWRLVDYWRMTHDPDLGDYVLTS